MPPRKANQAPPDFFFQVLKKSVHNASRDDPFGIKLVDRSKKSLYFSQMNIPRAQRPPYIMTKRLFCCFLDIPLANAVYILGVSERVMRKLRTWCGVTRWPRNDIVQQKVVLRERLKLMEEICESDPYGYEMLYRVHQTAGYDMSPLPNPRDFDADVPDNRQKQIEAVKAALEGPPADYKTVCQDFSKAAKVRLPSLEEKMQHVETFISNKCLLAAEVTLQQQADQGEPFPQQADQGEPFPRLQEQATAPAEIDWDQELGDCLDCWDNLDGVDYSILMQ